MPQLAYETLWDTAQFANMWPKDGSNPFFLAYNDNKGYGTHADYVFGWKDDSLQKAMDSSCMFNACENGKPLKSQGVAAMNKCAVKSSVDENLDGCKFNVPVVVWTLLMICRRAQGTAWYEYVSVTGMDDVRL